MRRFRSNPWTYLCRHCLLLARRSGGTVAAADGCSAVARRCRWRNHDLRFDFPATRPGARIAPQAGCDAVHVAFPPDQETEPTLALVVGAIDERPRRAYALRVQAAPRRLLLTARIVALVDAVRPSTVARTPAQSGPFGKPRRVQSTIRYCPMLPRSWRLASTQVQASKLPARPSAVRGRGCCVTCGRST
jgi:hypothetical protein